MRERDALISIFLIRLGAKAAETSFWLARVIAPPKTKERLTTVSSAAPPLRLGNLTAYYIRYGDVQDRS